MRPNPVITSLLPANQMGRPLSYYLRHELNVHCLIEIFQQLEFCDLLSICDLDTENDPFFTTLIRDHVICTKCIDFEIWDDQQSYWTIIKIFEVFGSSMRIINLPLHKHCLNKILRSIINYCTPGTINEIRLTVKEFIFNKNYFERLDLNLILHIKPFVSNLRSLFLKGMYFWDQFKYFFALLINQSPNLRTINLMNFTMENFIDLITAEKLAVTNLRMYNMGIGRYDLMEFIRKMPNLEVLDCDLRMSIDCIGRIVPQNCPNLRSFGLVSINIDHNNYNFLGKMHHLTELALRIESPTDRNFGRILQILAKKNILQKLVICYYREYLDVLHFRNNLINFKNGFSSLTNIEFHIQSREDLHKNGKFFQNLMTHMEGLRSVTFVSGNIQNVHKIFQYAPGLRELNIRHAELNQMPKKVDNIRRTIKQIAHQRNEMDEMKPIRIIVNQQQAGAFNALRKIEYINVIETKKIKKYYDNLYNLC